MFRRSSAAALPVFFALTFGFFCVAAPRFASAGNFENLMAGYSFVAIVAMGQAFAILLRGIDLSVGAIVALAGMVVFDASLIAHLPGWMVLLLAVSVATLAGALNGWLIVGLRLQPFIATLATLAAYRGLVFAISGRKLMPELSTTALSDPWIVPSPVRGLRACRARRSFTLKLPNPRSSTLSPSARARQMLLITSLTMMLVSFLLSPVILEISSTRSAFVMVLSSEKLRLAATRRTMVRLLDRRPAG